MSATTTIIQGASNITSKYPVEHSHPPTKSSSSNATPALDNPLDQGGPSMATEATLGDRSTSRLATLQRERAVFAAMCGALFLAGWNDGTTGPLLPRIQEVYHVWVQNHSHKISSLLLYYQGWLRSCISHLHRILRGTPLETQGLRSLLIYHFRASLEGQSQTSTSPTNILLALYAGLFLSSDRWY